MAAAAVKAHEEYRAACAPSPVKLLQPQAIVLDDIDRVGSDPRLLQFLAHRLDGLPIAYVREFVARLRVLGRETALRELEALAERARTIAASED